MKRKFLALVLIICLCFSVSACSAAPKNEYNGDVDGMYDAAKPGVAEGEDVEEDVGTNPNYNYEEVKENGFINPAEKPDSTFSLDRNTASYTYARKIINQNGKVATGSVRIEEYVNYFNYDYQRPAVGEGLAIGGTLSDCPWNSANKMFALSVSAEEISFENKKQNNIVFLIDTSGSMYGDERLGLIQPAFTMLTENLADNDIVSVVTYASGTRVAAKGMIGSDKVTISNVLQDLSAGGSTNGAGGIQLAYQTAEEFFIEGGNNRVILATDGDFNVGISSKNALAEFIAEKRDSGIWLSVLGVGMYNTNDTTMKTLAENGNGNYGYLDSLQEARKLLVQEMGGTLVTVAKDVKINVNFKPEVVKEYRLIGYETKMMSMDDFNNEQKDAGEIGSGHTVTAVYELVLQDGAEGQFASAEIRYKDPKTNEQKSISENFATEFMLASQVSEDAVFIGCVIEFGLILRNSEYRGDASFNGLISRLETLECVCGADADEFKAEFLQIAKKARSIYG